LRFAHSVCDLTQHDVCDLLRNPVFAICHATRCLLVTQRDGCIAISIALWQHGWVVVAPLRSAFRCRNIWPSCVQTIARGNMVGLTLCTFSTPHRIGGDGLQIMQPWKIKCGGRIALDDVHIDTAQNRWRCTTERAVRKIMHHTESVEMDCRSCSSGWLCVVVALRSTEL
jgi:hypothetical protein